MTPGVLPCSINDKIRRNAEPDMFCSTSSKVIKDDSCDLRGQNKSSTSYKIIYSPKIRETPIIMSA